MSPMSPRLLRPRQNLHPEAADWANRVRDNGGTVSGSTLLAVSRFCRAIDAAGIRDRFYRLNLLCGTGLDAALVPLYRNTSLAGSALGNATDTNAGGLFVSGDYTEATGLTAVAGGTKRLDTGLAPDNMPLAVVQAMALACSHGPTPGNLLNVRFLGGDSGTNRFNIILNVNTSSLSATSTLGRTNSLTSPTIDSIQPSVSWIVSRTSSTSLIIYKNGVSDATLTTSVTPIASHAFPFFIFRGNNQGSPIGDGSAMPARHYSIGASLTGAQAAAYETALAAFRTALGRTA